MKTELFYMTMYGALILMTLMTQVVFSTKEHGQDKLVSARDNLAPSTGIAARMERALNNSLVAMTMIAPVTIALVASDKTTAGTTLAWQVFLTARLIYVPLYAFGVPFLRTGVWMVGFLSTAYLHFVALSAGMV